MKFIKKFNESKKSPRVKIEDNMVVSTSLPVPSKEDDVQEMGFDPNQLNTDGGNNAYDYMTSIDDISDDKSKKFISKHVEPFEEWKKREIKKNK